MGDYVPALAMALYVSYASCPPGGTRTRQPQTTCRNLHNELLPLEALNAGRCPNLVTNNNSSQWLQLASAKSKQTIIVLTFRLLTVL